MTTKKITCFFLCTQFLLICFLMPNIASAKNDIGLRTLQKATSDNMPAFKYRLSMVYNNPGEAETVTKYTDPTFLSERGFNGMVPEWYIQCGITYDSFDSTAIPKGSAERTWILNRQNLIKTRLHEAENAGMPVYAFMDMLVLPKLLRDKYMSQLASSGTVPDITKAKTQEIIRAQLNEIFNTFPQLDGLIIRFGETYTFDTPYHAGGNPILTQDAAGIQGHINLINILRDEVCVKRNKKIFYRTWDFGFIHTNLTNYLAITNNITPHENLCFSIKYTNGDFHRMLPFNTTLGYGKQKYIVEYQGQPEYYGKGSHPIYVFGGLINGFQEYKSVMNSTQIQGLNQLMARDTNFVGLWSWARGGGWKGPYITKPTELWCDVNTLCAVEWAKNPALSENEILHTVLGYLTVENASIDKLISLLHKTDSASIRGEATAIPALMSQFYLYWARDQYFGGGQMQNTVLEYIINNNMDDAYIQEKNDAVALWTQIEALSKEIVMTDKTKESYLRTSSTYGRYKHDLIRQMMIIFLQYRRSELGKSYDVTKLRAAIKRYDEIWVEWKAFKAATPDCATLYTDMAFMDNTASGVGAYVDNARKLIIGLQTNTLPNGYYWIKCNGKYLTADLTPVEERTDFRDNPPYKEGRVYKYFYGNKPIFKSETTTDGSQWFYIVKHSSGNYKIINVKKAFYNGNPQWVHLNEYSNVSIREVAQARHLHKVLYNLNSGLYGITANNTADNPNILNTWAYDNTTSQITLGSTTQDTTACIFELVTPTNMPEPEKNNIPEGSYYLSVVNQYLTGANVSMTDNQSKVHFAAKKTDNTAQTQIWTLKKESNGKYSLNGVKSDGTPIHIAKDGSMATGTVNVNEETFDVLYDGQFYCFWSVLNDRSLVLNNDLNNISNRLPIATNIALDAYGAGEKVYVFTLTKIVGTAIENEYADNINFQIKNGCVNISNVYGRVQAFDLTGRQELDYSISGFASIPMNRGIHFFRFNNSIIKKIIVQ